MTLTEFLLARISEDEAVARRAEPGRWKLWGMAVMADLRGTSNVDDAIHVAVSHTPSTADGYLRTFNADHIARHDPARVLAECEAKRRIVERHARKPIPAYEDRPALEWCKCLANWPCPDVLSLAAVYADHPDYDESWRP